MFKVNLTLRTANEEEKNKAKRVVNQLRKAFGEESVVVDSDWDWGVEISVKETMGYVHHIANDYYLHVFRSTATVEGSGENKVDTQVDIDIVDIDTIYSLGGLAWTNTTF